MGRRHPLDRHSRRPRPFLKGGEVSITFRDDYPPAQVLREAADLLERSGRVERLNLSRRYDAPADPSPMILRVIVDPDRSALWLGSCSVLLGSARTS